MVDVVIGVESDGRGSTHGYALNVDVRTRGGQRDTGDGRETQL